jgi:hypothetical protein
MNSASFCSLPEGQSQQIGLGLGPITLDNYSCNPVWMIEWMQNFVKLFDMVTMFKTIKYKFGDRI